MTTCMGRQTFSEAAAVATGVQTFDSRFDSEDDALRMSISPWRCNLTALSQTANLYFVAYGCRIFVYIPQYRSQKLPQQPALIVTSQPSSSARHGYINPQHPHAINNLVVQLLGNEEVVAAVRDNGDVDAFFVRQIVHAIDRRAEGTSSLGTVADDVKPFFQSNVGMSAWGLAIHSKARILATSANTHNITIFKFGLVDSDEQEQPYEGEDSNENGATSDQRRKKDVTQQVLNGTSNIPHIAFCNTGDDLEARWLLTTDISGVCRSIDLHKMETAQIFRFGSRSYVSDHNFDRFNSGWTIMFLDKRSFLPEDTFQAALGFKDTDVTYPGVQPGLSVWDIADCDDSIFDASGLGTASSPQERRRVSRRGEGEDNEASSATTTLQDVLRDLGEDTDMEEAESGEREDEPRPNEAELAGYSEEGEAADMYSEDEDEGTEDYFPFHAMYGGRRIFGNEPQAVKKDENICETLPCPILHASVRSVYLLQPPHCAASEKRPNESTFTPPTVGVTNALRQALPRQHSWINSIERLNMSAYIPSIGVVVLASQKGRALVLSLTKLASTAKYPTVYYGGSRHPPKTVYNMRIDRILPLGTQEGENQRPYQPLAGIATGPMQGTEPLPDEKKRWRLMMYYYDHTILSYEIRRERNTESFPEAVDIQDVIV